MLIEELSFKVDHLIDGTVDLASYYYTNETYTLDKKTVHIIFGILKIMDLIFIVIYYLHLKKS